MRGYAVLLSLRPTSERCPTLLTTRCSSACVLQVSDARDHAAMHWKFLLYLDAEDAIPHRRARLPDTEQVVHVEDRAWPPAWRQFLFEPASYD